MKLLLEQWTSPISSLLLVTDNGGILRALEFADLEARMHRLLREHYGDYTLQEGAAPVSLTRASKPISMAALMCSQTYRSQPAARPFNVKFGTRYGQFRLGPQYVMDNSPRALAATEQAAQ